MSFDLAVFYSTRVLSKEEARRRYLELSDVEFGAPMIAFQQDLAAIYPNLDTITEDELDGNPWSIAHNTSDGHTCICMLWSTVATVAPIIFDLALKHGLIVYDPQDDEVYVPEYLAGIQP